MTLEPVFASHSDQTGQRWDGLYLARCQPNSVSRWQVENPGLLPVFRLYTDMRRGALLLLVVGVWASQVGTIPF